MKLMVLNLKRSEDCEVSEWSWRQGLRVSEGNHGRGSVWWTLPEYQSTRSKKQRDKQRGRIPNTKFEPNMKEQSGARRNQRPR
jgi:hypothetical protein